MNKNLVVLDRLINIKGNQARVEVLVKWANAFQDDGSWEDLEKIKKKYPTFYSLGQGCFEEEEMMHACFSLCFPLCYVINKLVSS